MPERPFLYAKSSFSAHIVRFMATALTRKHNTIPNHLHFIWFGTALPDFARLAILSALEHNPGSSATFWHDDELSQPSTLWRLRARGASLKKIDAKDLFAQLREKAPHLPVADLESIYSGLSKPAAKANVIRMVVLFLYGGIYLDTDTLTLKSMAPLRELGAFCGEEPTLWPAGTALLDPRAIVMSEIRRLCSLWPRGFRLHRRLLHRYTMAANNAVMGARAGHPFLAAMLVRAAALPETEQKRRYRLGTHLLQDTLRHYSGSDQPEDEMTVLSSPHFYPLGPEISRHFFHSYADPKAVSEELLNDETYVVHWYASVSDLAHKDAHFIRKSAHQSVYSSLCQPHVAKLSPLPVHASVVSPA